MDTIKNIIDLFLHIDKNLAIVIQNFGFWSYGLIFAIIFAETGLVIMPFLPGDSLLFAAGALSVTGSFNIFLLWGLIFLAAVLGDTTNYWIGHWIGPKVFEADFEFSIFGLKVKAHKIFKKKYLDKAQHFYDKHGGKAIVLARFVPIVRTFAPFVAGVGRMDYFKFINFNILGGFIWVTLFTFGGYFFGNLPIIKENFHYMILGIVVFSLIPIAVEVIRHKMGK